MPVQKYEQELATFYSSLETASAAHDAEGVLATMTEDVVLLAPELPPLVGKEAVRGFYKGVYSMFAGRGVHTPEWTEAAGDMVVQWGRFKGELAPLAGGNAVSVVAKYLFVFKRQPDGQLLLWRYSNSPDSPPAK